MSLSVSTSRPWDISKARDLRGTKINFTVPKEGVFRVSFFMKNNNEGIFINGIQMVCSYGSIGYINTTIPVSKGDIITTDFIFESSSLCVAQFIPYKE